MSELVVSGIALVMTAGAGWGVYVIVMSVLTACEDIATIKDELCNRKVI